MSECTTGSDGGDPAHLPDVDSDGDGDEEDSDEGGSRDLRPLKRSLGQFDRETQEVVQHAGLLLTVVLASTHLFPRSGDKPEILKAVTKMSALALHYHESGSFELSFVPYLTCTTEKEWFRTEKIKRSVRCRILGVSASD